MDQTEGKDDGARLGDSLGLARGVTLHEPAGLAGQLVVRRYTAPADDPTLPLRLGHWEGIARILDGAEGRPGAVEMAEAHAADCPPLSFIEDALAEMLAEELVVPNLITQVGDQYYGERASGIAGPPGQVTGMKLGTGNTAPSKTGAGAALVSYKTGSDKAIDATWPQSSLSGASRQIQWKTSWGAGVINGSALAEVVIINDVLADATSTAANTISRALFGPMTLGALDTLAITWNHLLLGA